MNRRRFLRGIAGILAAGVAPAAVGSGVLMPIKTLWTPPVNTLDDYEEGRWEPSLYVPEDQVARYRGMIGTYTKTGKIVTVRFTVNPAGIVFP